MTVTTQMTLVMANPLSTVVPFFHFTQSLFNKISHLVRGQMTCYTLFQTNVHHSLSQSLCVLLLGLLYQSTTNKVALTTKKVSNQYLDV